MAAINDLSLFRKSVSVHTSHAVLLDPKNVDVVVGIALISCIETEILRCSFLLPVFESHL